MAEHIDSMFTEVTFTNKTDTRAIVNEVVEHAFESVCSTMGPNGSYVVINQMNRPRVTKDGVSVAKALDFNEPRRNLIANIIMEPSIKTDAEVGDGTTTTVFMTYHLYQAFGSDMTFKNTRYLDGLIREVEKFLGGLVIPGDINSDEFRNMLMTSSNYEEEIVDKVLEIYKTHAFPNIRLINSPSLPADKIDYTSEIKFEGQFGAPNFIPKGDILNVGRGQAKIILIDGRIDRLSQKQITEINSLGLVFIIARNFEPGVINAINAENQRIGRTTILPYKINAAGTLGTDTIADLGKLIGVQPLFGIDNLDVELVKDPITDVYFHTTGILLDKDNQTVKDISDDILTDLDPRYEAMSVIDRQAAIGLDLFRRISRLRANNVIINVSGITPSDATERYYRYEDVMKAARTGQQFGVIPGIGYGYLKASDFVLGLPAQSDEGLEHCRKVLAEVLCAQYEHLTGFEYNNDGDAIFVDLVTGEESRTPMNVYDNAAATMTALKGAWQTAKTLGKISNVMGRSNKTYS